MDGATPRAPSPGSSAATICRRRWSIVETGSCRDGLHPDRANENRGGESVVSYLLGLAEIRQLARMSSERAKTASVLARSACAPDPRRRRLEPEAALPQADVPEPAGPLSASRSRRGSSCAPSSRRPSRATSIPPTRPGPTTSSIACWRSTRPTAASQLADVLENFQGRHRNLLATFEARADEMEDAFDGARALHARSQRQLVGAYFLHEYSFEAAALFNPSIVAHPDQSRRAGGRPALHPQPARGRRGPCLVADVPVGHDHRGWQRQRRSDGAPRRRCPSVRDRVAGLDGDDVDVAFTPDDGHQRAGDLSGHRRAVERHRGCPLRRVRRGRRDSDLLRHLHRL